MTESTNSTERFRAIVVIFATLSTIAFNALAAAGLVNGVTTLLVSAKYTTVVTPAGYAFTIWSLIYVGMIAFSVYQALSANLIKFRGLRTLYVLSCLLNCSWIYFWHREYIGVCLIIILALLGSLLVINLKLKPSVTAHQSLFTKVPFGLYFGWVTAAAVVNFAVWLTYLGVGLSPRTWNILGVVLILLTAAFGVLVRWKLKNYMYPLAVGWAATGIAVQQSGNTMIVVAAAVAVVVCLVVSVSFVMDLKSTTDE